MGLKMAFNGPIFGSLKLGKNSLNKMSLFGHKMNLFIRFDVITLILYYDSNTGIIE
jgi:hypothetical protein